jgi:hypothetical protein
LDKLLKTTAMGMAFDKGPFNEDIHMERDWLGAKDRYGIKNVIETGTYHGTTTAWFLSHFDKVISCEINLGYHQQAKENLEKHPNYANLNLICGSSTDFLNDMLTGLDMDKTAIFLDAHWYENPLLKELEILAAYRPKLICIHDMQNPHDSTMGYDSYPEQGIVYNYDWVKPYLEKIYPQGYEYYYNVQATGARRGALWVTSEAE